MKFFQWKGGIRDLRMKSLEQIDQYIGDGVKRSGQETFQRLSLPCPDS